MMRRSDLPKSVNAKQFTEALSDYVSLLQRQIDVACAAFPINETDRQARRVQALDELRYFAITYFPHYLSKDPSLLHDFLFTRLPEISAEGGGARDVLIAPRGSAKSTIVSLIYPIWRLLTGRMRYGMIIMDAYAQAVLQIEAIKAELESNPRLTYDFPEICGKGRVWKEGEIVTVNNVRLQGVGAGMKLRGRRHGPYRPDFICLDDLENDESVRSPDQRDKLENWILKTVLKLGAADGSIDIVYVGTLLHYDAVIQRFANKPNWKLNRFKALMTMPSRMDLWERFEEHIRNNDDDGETARNYYLDHKAEMDEGAVLNWPAMQSLLQLMMERIESPAAFASEQQGEPVSDNSPFKDITYWVQKCADWVFFGAIDPSLGRKGQGRDPSAILVGGVDRSGRAPVLDVVEALIRPRLPDLIIADCIALQKEYRCNLWFIEAIQFQEFFRTEIMVRALAEGVALPAMPVMPHTDKRLRIERLQPPVSAGLIRLHSSQTTLIQQLTQFPDADHDDGPDCLDMLWQGAIKHAGMAAPLAGLPIGYGQGRSDLMKGYGL